MPAVAVLEFGLDDVLADFVAQRITFCLGQADDGRGMRFVNEQAFALGHRVSADDGCFHIGHAYQLFFGERMFLHYASTAGGVFFLGLRVFIAVVAITVHVVQALQALFHGFRQRIVSGRGAGKVGVAQHLAVLGRHFNGVQG